MAPPKPSLQRRFHSRLAQTTLLVLLLISLAPVLVMGSGAYLQARRTLQLQIYNLLSAVSRTQGQRLNAEVTTGELLLQRAVHDVPIRQALLTALQSKDRQSSAFTESRIELLNGLQTINQPSPYFNQFLVLKNDGTIHLASKRSWEGTKLPADISQTLLSGKHSTLALYGFASLYPQSFVILTTVPIADSDEAFLIGVAESQTVRAMMSKASFYTTNQFIVTPDGEFIGINPYPDSFEKLVPLEPSSEQTAYLSPGRIRNSQGVVNEMMSFKGLPVIAAYTWLPELEIGWVTEISKESVYGQINAFLVLFGIMLTTIVIATVGVTWLASKRIVQPMIRLANTVQSFTEGNWEARAPTDRKDEIGLLAYSFNQLAGELSELYLSLEQKVAEKTRQVRISAEVSQIAISSTSMDELLVRVVRLIAEYLHKTHVFIYLLDETNNAAILRQSSVEEALLRFPSRRVPLETSNIVGWVIKNNQSFLGSLQSETFPFTVQAHLLSKTKMVAGVPIAAGERVFGALYLQSESEYDLIAEQIDEFQSLANTIASAIRSFFLLEATQVNLQETSLLYAASHRIAQAETKVEVLTSAQEVLEKTPYRSALFLPAKDRLETAFLTWDLPEGEDPARLGIPLTPDILQVLIPSHPLLIGSHEKTAPLPPELLALPTQFGCHALALLPVFRSQQITSLLAVGIKADQGLDERVLTPGALQPYINLLELIASTLEKIEVHGRMKQSLELLETVDVVSKAIVVETEIDALAQTIHKQLTLLMGETDFVLALYNETDQTITVPYMVEQGERLSVSPFPLGKGLTSILINSRKPLLFVENTGQQMEALGALLTGDPAKSWLGVPLLLHGQPIGAMIVQDIERERRYTEDHLRLMVTISGQVALAVHNVRLLEEAWQRAEHERKLYEITSKIRQSTNIQTILKTTTEELAKVFEARRAQIEIQINEHIPTGNGNGQREVSVLQNVGSDKPE